MNNGTKETQMKIHIALMEIKSGKLASKLIEEVSEEQFETMNEAALEDKTGFKYIQVNPLQKELNDEEFGG